MFGHGMQLFSEMELEEGLSIPCVVRPGWGPECRFPDHAAQRLRM